MLTPLRAIRAKCLDCTCYQPSEVRKCTMEDCPLHPFRFGKNPNREGIGRKNAFSKQKECAQQEFVKKTA